jgi:hypothetical protein
MSFMSNFVIHVKSCHLCPIVYFMANHVIYVKPCHTRQIMSFMSNHVIHVKSSNNRVIHFNLCHACHILSFMLPFMTSFMFISVIICVIGGIFNKVEGLGRGGGVKKCFQAFAVGRNKKNGSCTFFLREKERERERKREHDFLYSFFQLEEKEGRKEKGVVVGQHHLLCILEEWNGLIFLYLSQQTIL